MASGLMNGYLVWIPDGAWAIHERLNFAVRWFHSLRQVFCGILGCITITLTILAKKVIWSCSQPCEASFPISCSDGNILFIQSKISLYQAYCHGTTFTLPLNISSFNVPSETSIVVAFPFAASSRLRRKLLYVKWHPQTEQNSRSTSCEERYRVNLSNPVSHVICDSRMKSHPV